MAIRDRLSPEERARLDQIMTEMPGTPSEERYFGAAILVRLYTISHSLAPLMGHGLDILRSRTDVIEILDHLSSANCAITEATGEIAEALGLLGADGD